MTTCHVATTHGRYTLSALASAHHGAHAHHMERHAACTRSARRPMPPSQIRYERTLPIHLTTCSERLRLWYTSVLRPRRVGLTLVLADVYKATWDDELHPTETERKVMRAPDEP